MSELRTSQFPATGVTQALVLSVLDTVEHAVTCKEIGYVLDIDTTIEKNLKSISNACGYLVVKNLAHRVGPGTYKMGPGPEKGTEMTMTEYVPPTLSAVPPHAEAVDGSIICGECGQRCKSPMGLKAHMTRAHSKGLTPDEMFERTGRALDVLFPEGIPASRVIELADLQKSMLRALKQ